VKQETTKPGSNPTRTSPTPAELLQRSVQTIKWRAADLAQLVAALPNIHGDGGVPLVDEVGIPNQDVTAITEELNLAVAAPLYRYGGVHQARQSVHHATAGADGAGEDAPATDDSESGQS
jgi:hypothetical protein